MNDPAMYLFLLLLLGVIVGMVVWFFTSEHYAKQAESLRQQNQILSEHNRVLQDELRKADRVKELSL